VRDEKVKAHRAELVAAGKTSKAINADLRKKFPLRTRKQLARIK
jgi:hypothetical protein